MLDLIIYYWYVKIDYGLILDIGKMVCSLFEVVRLFKVIDVWFKMFKKLIFLYKWYNYLKNVLVNVCKNWYCNNFLSYIKIIY